jgi:hypothetical protein
VRHAREGNAMRGCGRHDHVDEGDIDFGAGFDEVQRFEAIADARRFETHAMEDVPGCVAARLIVRNDQDRPLDALSHGLN